MLLGNNRSTDTAADRGEMHMMTNEKRQIKNGVNQSHTERARKRGGGVKQVWHLWHNYLQDLFCLLRAAHTSSLFLFDLFSSYFSFLFHWTSSASINHLINPEPSCYHMTTLLTVIVWPISLFTNFSFFFGDCNLLQQECSRTLCKSNTLLDLFIPAPSHQSWKLAPSCTARLNKLSLFKE